MKCGLMFIIANTINCWHELVWRKKWSIPYCSSRSCSNAKAAAFRAPCTTASAGSVRPSVLFIKIRLHHRQVQFDASAGEPGRSCCRVRRRAEHIATKTHISFALTDSNVEFLKHFLLKDKVSVLSTVRGAGSSARACIDWRSERRAIGAEKQVFFYLFAVIPSSS